MSENSVQNSVIEGRNGGSLLPGGVVGNAGGTGRPPEEFRRKAGEKLEHWLDRACNVLEGLASEATDYEQKIKFVESARKLGESFGKYTGLEKSEVVNEKPLQIIVVRKNAEDTSDE